MTPRKLLLAAAVVSTVACVKRAPTTPPAPTKARAVQLLTETAERETLQFEAKREDVEIDTRDFERTPRVVTTGETPELRLDGARARLYGNEAGTEGFSVDNCILLEVLDLQGKVLNRGVVGFSDPVDIGRERVDNIGARAFAFEAGAVDVTTALPESAPFKLRATVLDYSGVGRVSNVFLVLEPRAAGTAEDDLRER
ncbi:hypothetical protein P2318_26565 [Myxococcaceae bacterium GXIMD 01537]